MAERRGTKGLELWCRRMTAGYPGVNVTNMTTSWRDGLAFCAIIHHFRPELIEFSKLNKDNVYHNNELAFRVAESHLGIPALLEAEDMVEFPVPDRLSILTYLSQFYQTFGVAQGKSPARVAPKRPVATSESSESASPPSKMSGLSAVGKQRREPCTKCRLPVFIAERLYVGKKLYHRMCFRCARCDHQLTLADFYETENNEFCCETCPDEEPTEKIIGPESPSVLTKSLSDEEKSASLKQNEGESAESFRTALDESIGKSRYAAARSFFALSQPEEPPQLPKSRPPALVKTFSDSDLGVVNSCKVDDRISASSLVNSQEIDTKDRISAAGQTSSLVKARMRLFEEGNLQISNDTTNVPYRVKSVHDMEQSKSRLLSSSEPKNLNELADMSSNGEAFITAESSKTSIVEISDDSALTVPDPILISDESVIIIDSAESSKFSALNEESLPTNIAEEVDDQDVVTELLINTPQEVKAPESLPAPQPVKDPEQSPEHAPELPLLCETPKDPNSEHVPPVDTPKTPGKEPEPDYPGDLNPFDDVEPPPGSNPFDEEEDEVPKTPQRSVRKIIMPATQDSRVPRVNDFNASLNPFDDDDDEPPVPATRKILRAPRISLNPFWSDEEEQVQDKPVPKPRIFKTSPGGGAIDFGSLSSISSSQSSHKGRKKKQAPRPPLLEGESGPSSLTSSPSQSAAHSPRATPKFLKSRKAPHPPCSTPIEHEINLVSPGDVYEVEKSAKDQQNRTRQSLHSPSGENAGGLVVLNKSTHGQWKRKKGKAPSRPIPQRRVIKSLPLSELRHELEVIEIQQQGLEKQGVRLEEIIRSKCEGPDSNPDELLAPEIEEMVLQLFELVNEKNELFRRQAELMYLRRQQKLEEEHAEVEYQIRCLLSQPEANKTDYDKTREEELISRLVEIVESRSEIIDCLDMDRLREAEEDSSITNQLSLYTSKKEEEEKPKKKDKKKHKSEKKAKKGQKLDDDKDIDEWEGSTKDKKKKKFAIFS